jgi:ATP-dependent Clp protease ATP-binding subunit ClpA
MFERFTQSARSVVMDAQAQARGLGHNFIGTEHLLLSLLEPGSGAPAGILGEAGVRHDDVVARIRQLLGRRPEPLGETDAEALRAIGIDLDAVVAAVENLFGPGALRAPQAPPSRWTRVRRRLRRSLGRRRRARTRARLEPGRVVSAGGHIPFTARSKKVLELSLREAVRLGHKHIGSEHILLGLIREGEGMAAQILVQSGLTLEDLRQRTLRALKDAA